MGSNDVHPEERLVDGFWMDERPVTNAEFRRFVKAGVIELESVWYTDGNAAFAKAFRSQQT